MAMNNKPRRLFPWSPSPWWPSGVPAGSCLRSVDWSRSQVTRLVCGAALSVLLGGLSPRAEAGTLSTGFGPADVIPGTLYGSAIVDVSGGVGDSGVLKMNTANGQAGFLVLDDLDGGQAVGSFVATFNLRTGSDTSTVLHGDGFSFSFGPDIPDETFTFPEEGTGSGLRVSFDTFNNAGPANEAPAVEVTFGNQIIASKAVDFLSTGTGYVAVRIQVDPEGTLDVLYGTNAVFTNLLCYSPVAGRFSLAANAEAERFVGDPIDLYWLDNLSIATTVSQSAFVQSANPRGSTVSPDAFIVIQLQDVITRANTNSVQLKLDNGVVAASVNHAGGLTTITYDPPGFLAPGSTHRVELAYADDAVPPKTNFVGYSFTVHPYVNLPPGYAVSAGSLNTNSPGFKLRTHQVAFDVGTSVQRAELQLANKLLNPLDGTVLANTADLSTANPDGTFDVPGHLDFSTLPSPGGFFLNDVPPPGLVGTDHYALEIMTFLNLTPGAYTFGVNAVRNYNTTAPGTFRESGFRLTAGANPRDLFAPEIASFDRSRPEGENQFSLVVQQAGIYPFRLLWFSGAGESSLEWYQVTPQGDRILVGDIASGGLTAYRDAVITHPYVQYTTTPRPGETGVAPDAVISLTVVDGSATVQTNTIQLSLNGGVVTASISNNPAAPGLTLVNFKPPGALAAGSTITVRLVFTDSGGSPYDQQWSFVVAGNAVIPGLLAIEAEHFHTNTPIAANGTSWELTTLNPGFSAEGAMEAVPNVNLNVNVDTTISPRLDYNLNFAVTGTYYVWVRALADSAPGSSQSDSVNVGIDGVLPDSSAKITGFPPGGYVWSRTTVASTPATIIVSSAGPHAVNVWMREDGFIFDKLLLTTNNAYIPTGFGPAETTATDRPVLTYNLAGNSLQISWTGEGALQSAGEAYGPYTPVTGAGTNSMIILVDQPRRFFRVVK